MSPSPVIPSRAFLFPGFESFMCYSDLCLWMQACPDRVVLILMILTVMGVTALWWLDDDSGNKKRPVTGITGLTA